MQRKRLNNNFKKNKGKLRYILLFSIGIFFLLSFFFSDKVGFLGILFINNLINLLGITTPIISFLILLLGLYGIFSKKEKKRNLYIGFFLLNFSILITFHIKYVNHFSLDKLFDAFSNKNDSGLIGALITNFLYNIIGIIGISILLPILYISSIVLFINFFKPLNNLKEISNEKINNLKNLYKLKKEFQKKEKLKTKEEKNFFEYNKKNDNIFLDENNNSKKPFIVDIIENTLPQFNQINSNNNNNINNKITKDFYKKNINLIKWKLPPISLLNLLSKDINKNKKEEIQKIATLLENTLDSFGINIRVKEVSCGPSLTRYEAILEPGTKVSKIQNLSEDIALALAATSVRIEAPIPGKSAVGFEIPNKKIEKVSFREIMSSSNFSDSNEMLTIGLGKDITGKTVIASLDEMPHMLIAGATGSGKSVCLNTLICSLLFKYTPDELKFLLIDTKKVELTPYNDIPHLVAPVITNSKRSAVALKWMVSEMENRYEKLSNKGVRDIKNYNKEVCLEEKIPYVVIIIDELADLMMAAPVDVETSICRIAQKARAAGIHLVVATQRPSVQIITGDIKSNIPRRIAFAVFSQIDARTILDTSGAEKLLGNGDMLYTNKGGKLLRVQGAYISEKEIISITNFLKKQGKPEYLEGVEIIETEDFENNIDKTNNLEDPLLKKAAQLILESNQASISILQRKLKIGYSRGARLIDLLEEKGFVGPAEGTKSRDILGNWKDFGHLFGEQNEL